MNLFRSETMQYFKVVIPKSNAVKILSAMETIGHIHFVDRSANNGKPAFAETIKRCGELLSRVIEIEKKMKDHKFEIKSPLSLEKFYGHLEESSRSSKDSDEKVFADIDYEINKLYERVTDATAAETSMKEAIYYLKKKLCFYNLLRTMAPEESLG